MRVIGVVVEGISDRDFWRAFFARKVRQRDFSVRVVQTEGRPNLITNSAKFLETYRDAGYAKTIFILDRHSDPCVGAVLSQFPPEVRDAPDAEILVAVKGIETWILADGTAVRRVLGNAEYVVPRTVELMDPRALLNDLSWKGRTGSPRIYKKTTLLPKFGKVFEPDHASRHSPSFRRAWSRLSAYAGVGGRKSHE